MFAGSLLFAIQIYYFFLFYLNRLNVRDTPRNVKMQRFAVAGVWRVLYYEAAPKEGIRLRAGNLTEIRLGQALLQGVELGGMDGEERVVVLRIYAYGGEQ